MKSTSSSSRPNVFANADFAERVLTTLQGRVSLFVVDEAHCISDWGHDFRPQYRRIERLVRALPANVRLLATTATANDRVMDDLRDVLGPGLEVHRGDLLRPSLALQTIRLPDQAERLAWMADYIPQIPGSGIIYALTVRDVNLVADWLRSRDIDVAAYSSKSEDREALEQALADNRIKALVATTALGMGFDKPDLAFVVHYQTPGSVVAYYQQVGRAGRALSAAHGVLLSGREETEITEHFIESAFPTRDEVDQVLAAIESATDGLSIPKLEGRLNLRRNRIVKTIELLALESPAPIVKEGSRWQLTAVPVADEFWQRTERLTQLRRDEQRQMQDYVALEDGHMAFLVRALDGDPTDVVAPPADPLPTTPSRDSIHDAISFLRRSDLPIAPRAQWPAGGLAKYGVRGRIKESFRAEEGRALCRLGDAGWGREVDRAKQRGEDFEKHRDEHLDDTLVAACVEMFRRWLPEPAPMWVTAVPSLRRPRLVSSFARRLADALGLPFHDIVVASREHPQQVTMQNAVRQARNLDGVFEVATMPSDEPVLLVDDIVGSRWTSTVVSFLLRKAGSGPVRPLALAYAGTDG